MRSLYIASAILLALIILIILNSFYVTSKIDSLLLLCDEIEGIKKGSPDSAEAKLLAEWDDCRSKLSLSISHTEIDRAESALFQLASFRASGSTVDFHAQMETFRSALLHISDAQKLLLENIL